jgi:hypothetical protein
MEAVGRADQLRRHTDALRRAADRALQHVGHAQFRRDLRDVQRAALVAERRGARGDQQVRRARQRVEDFFCQAVGEPRLVAARAEIGEGQYCDRFFRDDRRIRGRPRDRLRVRSYVRRAPGPQEPARADANAQHHQQCGGEHRALAEQRGRWFVCSRRRLGALDSLRRQLQCPAQHQRDRKTQYDERDHQAQAPRRHTHLRQHDVRGLQHGERRRGVHHRHPNDLATLEFGEQAHRPDSARSRAM